MAFNPSSQAAQGTVPSSIHSLDSHKFAGPWVTSVGGTAGGMESDDPEVANGISGGGFSVYFRPRDYQVDTMTAFFENPDNHYPGYSGFYR